MLFNSYPFIFLFMPILVGILFLLKSYTLSKTHLLLVGASLLFYAMLDVEHLPILLFSALVNYTLSLRLTCKEKTKPYLIMGIIFNLALLGGYKYLSFFASLLHLSFPNVAAPLGISFFTFHQLAYLIDIYTKRTAPTTFKDYALYVTFFPHLIAGPIMRYTQFEPQLRERPSVIPYATGVLFFCVGLFKKVSLADTYAPIAERIFDAPKVLSSGEALKGLLAYTWQIYFDFSGYADMAIGLGLMCGIALPINFLAPYKAHSISDFWRRWHISLSQFLRDYLYIPLGGNRFGYPRQMLALLVTMSLAGLWHGASWNFVLWGALHGSLLVLAHSWKRTLGRHINLPVALSTLLTFISVMLLWVLFRAPSLNEALHFYTMLFSFSAMDITFDTEWLLLGVGALIVFTCKPLVSWTHYTLDTPLSRIPKPTLTQGFVAAILALIALKMMSTEPSRSFVYFVF